ncbi:RNA-binding S4 domain-containing protein [Maribius pontilimi]|uniref:RNA-binding S4 domain-containing protein n=1 Tax=Palleronia pontilimi TaxID=1964209 RepID=A0A934I7X1_9RHOB|nr:RNA-binding S4 domain-containing protein [Palleronia pontilimi]MBJ3762084.1 RNA-binding S4 domain-containing protein [Palleronia pontilimi]
MEPRSTIRLDKWLFYARFFKTRSVAAKVVTSGGVRVDGTRVSKPSAAVGIGDTLTFAQGRAIRVVKVLALGDRRGPAPEAQALYDDHSPPPPERVAQPVTDKGGKPSKKDRRDMNAQGFGRTLE